MLRAAMALLSTLQIGARIKESLERSLRQAAVIAVAVVFCAAAVFGLIAAITRSFDLSVRCGRGRGDHGRRAAVRRAHRDRDRVVDGPQAEAGTPSPLVATPDPTAMLDQGVGKAMQQVGPVPLLAIAFIAGVLFGRR